jgi:hypothetical protein
MAESKSGGGTSATAEKQQKTDTALKQERGKDAGDRYGGDEPLPYPETEVQDSITYRDPRPLDWPQKADRSVMVGAVHQVDPDDDVSGDYIDNAGLADQEELEIGGTLVKDAQVVAGGGQLTLIINGEAFVLGGLGGGIQADLARALQLNANS